MKSDFHCHTKWCDGRAGVEEMALAAIEKGFCKLGFSSHSMLPSDMLDWALTVAKAPRYAADVREVAESYKNKIEISLGVEADFLPGVATCDRKVYSDISPDYIIGSVHFVASPTGANVIVDMSPENLKEDVEQNYDGDFSLFVKDYFRQERLMVETCDFDIIGHADLVRKFNSNSIFFDESDAWYKGELEATADAIATSNKIVEVNTGAIYRGYLQDAYPSAFFRSLLRARGVSFILSSDAHCPQAIGYAFNQFEDQETYLGHFRR